MTSLLGRPKRVYIVLGIAIVALFALSAVGNTGTAEENANSSVGWIGAIGWFGFCLTVLATIVFSVLLVIHRSRRRTTV